MIIAPTYTDEMISSVDEEQRVTDAAEEKLRALLVNLLGNDDEPAPVVAALRPRVVASLAQPVLESLTRQVYEIMAQRAPKNLSFDTVHDVVSRVTSRALDELANRVVQINTDFSDSDVYQRDVDGPDGAEKWARGTASTVVTDVVEDTKSSLAAALGLTHGRWLTRLDALVRTSHRVMEGQTQPIGTAFTTGAGNSLERPGDPSAPLSERINCRCRVLYFRSEEQL